MRKTVRSRYTLEFKQEAVRLVQSKQSMAAVLRSLGVVEQNSISNALKPLYKATFFKLCSGADQEKPIGSMA